MKGYFQKGKSRHTKGQLKVHFSQLNDFWIDNIRQTLLNTLCEHEITCSDHALHVINIGKVTFCQYIIERTLENFLKGDLSNFIEINQVKGRTRVLLKDKNLVQSVNIKGSLIDCNLCFVLDLHDGSLITLYWNEVGDDHDNIDMRRYVKNIKELAYFK